MLENYPQLKEAGIKNLCFGTVESWLLYKLCSEHPFIAEVSNASRMILMTLKSCKWAPELTQMFGITKDNLGEIRESTYVFGHLESGPLAGVPITGILGNQQASLLG